MSYRIRSQSTLCGVKVEELTLGRYLEVWTLGGAESVSWQRYVPSFFRLQYGGAMRTGARALAALRTLESHLDAAASWLAQVAGDVRGSQLRVGYFARGGALYYATPHALARVTHYPVTADASVRIRGMMLCAPDRMTGLSTRAPDAAERCDAVSEADVWLATVHALLAETRSGIDAVHRLVSDPFSLNKGRH
jgi:hypothetical protein